VNPIHGAGHRLLLLVGIAATLMALIVTVRGAATPTTSVSGKCPEGESEDVFTGVCVPGVPPSIIEVTPSEFGGEPEVDGIPCNGGNSYECIGLAEESLAAGPTPSATSTMTAQGDPSNVRRPPTGQDLTSSAPPPPTP
jgi:hypothetical protein